MTWKSYLDRRSSASSLLKRHLQLFPESEEAAAALYYLGRLSAASGDPAAAKAYQQAILARYPNYYYAVLARERLSEKPVSTAGVSPSVNVFISSLRLAPAGSYGDFGQDAATKLRIDRARLLSSAGFPDLAETELRFAASTDSKPALLAIELAQSAARRGAVDKSLRYIKSVSPGYLNWDLESAPSAFWLLAFPMPFKQSLEKRSKENDLDPNMVAALVRQESEFDPMAVSHARAVGLTQVLPGTGREVQCSEEIGRRGGHGLGRRGVQRQSQQRGQRGWEARLKIACGRARDGVGQPQPAPVILHEHVEVRHELSSAGGSDGSSKRARDP